jgi:hypothetical protein
MEEKQITFQGLNLTPYSDISPDGQCSVMHNLELHHGSLRPSVLAGKEYTLPASGYTLVHVHATSAFRHFIFTAPVSASGVTGGGRPISTVILWAAEDGDSMALSPEAITGVSSVLKVTALGNTLVILTDEGLLYYLWSEGAYKYIGNKPPELGIQFSLERKERFDLSENSDYHESAGDPIEAYISGSTIYDDYENGRPSGHTVTSDFLWACTNKLISDFNNNCLFYAPFFVRFAYKLYDGTITMASHPVLVVPCTSLPAFYVNYAIDEGNKIILAGVGTRFFFKLCMLVDKLGNLEDWKDIVSSVDIYITPQQPRWKYNTVLENLNSSLTGYGIWSEFRRTNSSSVMAKENFLMYTYNTLTEYYPNDVYVGFKEMTDEDYKMELVKNSLFYKVAEYKIDELKAKEGTGYFTNVKFALSTLTNLVQQDLLDERYDYRSHDTVVASNCMVYNSRLNLFDVQRYPFKGFSPAYMHQWMYNTKNVDSGSIEVYVYIHAEDGMTRVVRSAYSGNLMWPGIFFYYPDNRAYKIVYYYGGLRYELPLSVHPALNGAYYLAWDEIDVQDSSGSTIPNVVSDAVVEENKIYCSDVNNPYVFPSSGIYTVGTGKILGVGTVATPLSTGQAGQFKLIFFCSDGNYAYNIASDGTLSENDNTLIQRDICSVPSSLTVLDREMLFLSARGVMSTDQSQLRCLSEVLDGVSDTLPGAIAEWDVPSVSIPALLSTEFVAYDYANQRVIFMASSGQSYVLSLQDGTWSTASFPAVKAVLNIYPASYVQLAGTGNVVRLDSVYDYTLLTPRVGYLLTRPLKLDSLQLKRLMQFALEGKGFSSTTYLFGSQDGERWFLLGSTSAARRQHLVGRSFKFFRLGMVVSMGTDDNLSGVRLGYIVNPEKRFR